MPLHEYLKQRSRAKFSFIFIVSYGRSGSTLLQGLLNSIPQYCIRGENFNAAFHMFRAYQHLLEGRERQGRKRTDPTKPWYGIDTVMPEAFARRCASVFLDTCLRPPNGTRCTGFKEIRYTCDFIPDEEFVPYIDFLCKFFPGAGFLFNVRRPENAARSGWWKNEDSDAVVKLLSHAQARFRDCAESRDNAMIFDYDELMSDWRYAESLFEFLDEEFDAVRARSVLEIKHSYS